MAPIKIYALALIVSCCTGVRIGLPDDHVDTASCFDSACISENDWIEIGTKWNNFRETVKIMSDINTTDIRAFIWRTFQDGRIWNGDATERAERIRDIRNMRTFMDQRVEEIREVQLEDATTRYDHQAIIAMEGDITVEKAAHYLYNKNPEVSTLYKYSPLTDTLRVVAGNEHFLGKHSRVQVVGHGRHTDGEMKLSKKSSHELAKVIRKLPIKMSELGRVSLVGCNIGASGQSDYLNDGFTEKFLKSLNNEQSIRTEVSSRNGLVSVTVSGKKETGEISPDGTWWFSKDPRMKTVMKLGDFNEVIRAELPLTDRIPTLNKESSGSLVKLTNIDRNRGIQDNIKPIYIAKKIKAVDLGPDTLEVVKKIKHGDIGEFLNVCTKNIFLDEIAFVQQNLIGKQSNTKIIQEAIKQKINKNTPKIELVTTNVEKITEKQSNSDKKISYSVFQGDIVLLDPLTKKAHSPVYKFQLKFNTAGHLKMRLVSGVEIIGPLSLETGIAPNWKYVARLNEAHQRVVKVEDVRTINSRADLIYEVNILGTFGVDYRNNENLFRYYRFGDVVYRMKRSNFYIYWDGMIASEDVVRTKHFNDGHVKETEILNLKPWIWRDENNRYDIPKDSTFERYPDMRDKVQTKYADRVINRKIAELEARGYPVSKNTPRNINFNHEELYFELRGKGWSENYHMQFDSGNVLKLMNYFKNGDHVNIERNVLHVLEGSTVLAIALSEPIRNFRTFSIDEMLIHLNKIEPISFGRLIEIHPMTRGQSWGFVGHTGLAVSLLGYGWRQAELVLPRELNIARRFLLSRVGEDGQSQYRFLTETEYSQAERNMAGSELSKITTNINLPEIRNTLLGFRPEITDEIVRTPPLGDIETPTVTDMHVYSEVSSTKAMPIRASVSVVNDYIFVTNHISKLIAEKNIATDREYEIIESSIQVENGNIKFRTRDKSNPLLEEEFNIRIEEESLSSNSIKKEASQRLEEIHATGTVPSKELAKVNEFLGVYGIVMGFRGAVQDFENGKIFEGIMNVAQSVHGIFGMSQTAQKAFQTISSKLLSTGLQEVETGLTVASTEISTALAEGTTAAEESLTAAGEAAGDVPILGTIFGVYNTIQDIRQGTAIGYVDAALDAAITVSALFGPEALVVTVALTIVRLAIDDFYYAISNEIKNLPPDATVLQTIGAVMKGIAEGVVMVIEKIADFLSLGFNSFAETFVKIDKQYNKDHALLQKMSDFHNYFKIEKEEGSTAKLIDFAAGEESWNGGEVLFHLYDDNTARFRMKIVDDCGQEQVLDKYINLEEDANDIVLGIGESHDISFKKQSAKIFWFIPVHSRKIISKVRGERNTLHGSYYGNSKHNKFFAIQKIPDGTDLDYSLADYYYELYGEDGDDIFYLGPQKSKVTGGNGRDTYVVPYSGGRTIINNYATDLLEDVLFIQVNFEELYVDRSGNDLILRHGYDHDVTVMNWFSGHRMGHMVFKANQGVIFNVTIGVYGTASVVPLAIILAGEKEQHTIDVSKGVWKHVVLITGSEASDVIVANDKNNLIDGGMGSNTMRGGAGSDTYLINSVDTSANSDWNVINNFDTTMTVDKVIFDVPYNMIVAQNVGNSILLYTSTRYGPKVNLDNWFSSEHYRHMLFVTTDDVIFKLTDDRNDPNILHPIILDASKEKSSVILDANTNAFVNVSTIIGSDFNDVITGNTGNNYIKGGVGVDEISGGEGRDVYVIRQEDIGDVINNFAEDKKDDLILVDFDYNDISVNIYDNNAVLLSSSSLVVTIKNWVKGDNWRHIVIRTIDGISFKLESVGNSTKKAPIEIDKSSQTQRQEIMTQKRSLLSVEHIIGSNATDYLTGNNLANIIDPCFGGAYMMGLGGHDQYVIMDHYNGPNIINNFATDNLADTVKLPSFFNDIQSNISGEDVIVTSSSNPSAKIILQKYKTDRYHRHLVIKTVMDGIIFTLPPAREFQPTAISIDRTNQAHNLIVDLSSNATWSDVLTVLGTKDHSNVIRGNQNNNTITGGKLSDTIEGGDGNDVIRGEEGEDFIDGGDGDDILAGGAGDDWIDGGMGDDVIYPGPGADHVKGGPGFDTVVVFGDALSTSGVFIDLLNGHGYGGDAHGDIYVSIEGVIGGFYNDILIGDHENNYIDGKESNDILYPLNGIDILVGGDGTDLYDIGDSSGEKIIQNKATDEAMDTVNLKIYELESIYLEQRFEHLVVHVGVVFDGLFCPKYQTGPYLIENWYMDLTCQHITIQLANSDLVLDKFETGGLNVHSVRPDTQERREECDEIIADVTGHYDYMY